MDRWPCGGSLGRHFVADTLNNVIREIDRTARPRPWRVRPAEARGDGGPATLASFNHPSGIAVDAKGNLYINDENNFLVRRVGPIGSSPPSWEPAKLAIAVTADRAQGADRRRDWAHRGSGG